MCLAAKFPLPTSTKNTLSQDGCNIVVEEPEVEIIDPDGTTIYHKARLQRRMENHTHTSRAYLVSEHDKRVDEEVISLQNSPDSLILQANEELRSSSGSDLESEDRPSSPNLNKDRTQASHSPPTKWTAAFQEYQSHFMRNGISEKLPVFGNQKIETVADMGHNENLDAETYLHGYPINPHIQVQEIPIRSASNSWLNMTPEFGKHETACHEKEIDMSKSMKQIAGSSSPLIAQRTTHPFIHAPRMGEIGGVEMQPGKVDNQHSVSSHQNEMAMASQLESSCIRQSVNHSEAVAKGQEGNPDIPKSCSPYLVVHTRNSCNITKFHAEGQAYPSSKQPSITGTSISKTRKRKVEEGDKKAFDWDSLRKEVQSKSGKKERSKDAMDSLNYEAVRSAAVKEISDAIKERGMNNMLAERIKVPALYMYPLVTRRKRNFTSKFS